MRFLEKEHSARFTSTVDFSSERRHKNRAFFSFPISLKTYEGFPGYKQRDKRGVGNETHDEGGRFLHAHILIDLIVCYCHSFQFLLFWIIFHSVQANMTKEDVGTVKVEIAILKKVG